MTTLTFTHPETRTIVDFVLSNALDNLHDMGQAGEADDWAQSLGYPNEVAVSAEIERALTELREQDRLTLTDVMRRYVLEQTIETSFMLEEDAEYLEQYGPDAKARCEHECQALLDETP